MPGPDLTVARAQVLKLMDDIVRVTRDPKGADDAVLDEETGKLVGPGQPFEPIVVYEGPALIRPIRVSNYTEQAGARYVSSDYVVGVPWDAGDFKPGDDIACVSSRRDPTLVDRKFTTRDVPHQTYLVVRQLVAEMRQ